MDELANAAFGDDPGRWPLPEATTPLQTWQRAVAAGGQGRYASGFADLDAVGRTSGAGSVASLALSTRASFLRQLGRHVDARPWDGRALALAGSDADARADALSGNCLTVRRLGRPALAVAMCGDAAQAERLAAETSKLFPNGTIWNAVQLPEIRAAIALNRDQPAKSVELLVSAAPYERSYLEAVHLRGLAYVRMNKGAEAAAEFRKIVDHKGANWASVWRYPYWGQFYSLSYLGMARGSALAGDTAKAKKAFQDFFELWKDADPDLPILQQAKTEYAKLR